MEFKDGIDFNRNNFLTCVETVINEKVSAARTSEKSVRLIVSLLAEYQIVKC